MAKKNTLPSMDGEEELVASSSTCTAEAVHVMGHTIDPEPMTPSLSAVIELPMSSISLNGYVSKRVDVKVTREQCLAMRSVLRGLQDEGALLKNGRAVNNTAQAIQYILEQVSKAAGNPFSR